MPGGSDGVERASPWLTLSSSVKFLVQRSKSSDDTPLVVLLQEWVKAIAMRCPMPWQRWT